MVQNSIFSMAHNSKGKWVHVDDVPNGVDCNCYCPNCHEPLIARHGKVNEHGFAHHSKIRGANLRICYMVTMYKLAEHIIQTIKRIHTPSYYDIFKERDIEFIDVKIDSHYEREDKQPDVIGIAKDGKQYLIEFVFKYKVQHKKSLDYKNLNCLEIDLSNQTIETLETFLISTAKDRKWLNNETYFNQIEAVYRKADRPIRVVSENECSQCIINSHCCAVKKGKHFNLIIENSGNTYRLCKIEQFENELTKEKQRELWRHKWLEEKNNFTSKQERNKAETQESSKEITCFNCQNNLIWESEDGFASCGKHFILGITKNNHPDYAKECIGFQHIESLD
ncbi:MAG: hypothetical protein IJG81_10590 [Muribaculaceae bacterium]|nr:hypothetical protein [Muribaculaceae bacterium]